MQLAIDVMAVVGFVLIMIALLIIGFLFGMAVGGIVGAIVVPAYGFRIMKAYKSPEVEGEEII